ncbi:iron transporter [Candidatus Wolfebacteria bacterium CG10_big_fil_rev_8_21_14_0_10_31_9]|uniref:Iron transporter n=1 Tax=Candidatus Wolfebacteria bacterium CG10_big_fil_rev_8_21_14_0_10_31_9 TaxID=1975070 RepID=A0A2H0RBU2_9BACT|nr:MAG: iron transporter [Candidatus Wolfebacteria bacterium CG10_big_fil_rev_8_21_14_0_10_31_9]
MKNSLFDKSKEFFKKLGPGLVTGTSDDDPSGVLTYLQTGAVLGIKSLWFALFTLPMMYAIQEMCGRIGYVTDKGLIKVIKENYSKYILYPIAFFSVLVITINIGADLSAVGVILEKFTGIGRLLWIPMVSLFILTFMILFSYQKLAKILKWLTLTLFFYIFTTFFMNIDWISAIKSTFIPTFSFSKTNLILLTAILGTTISPYLFFWQANVEVEERDDKKIKKSLKRFLVTKNELKILREDTFLGMFFSNLVMWFIIVGASYLGSAYGIAEIQSFDQVALILKPLLGNFAFTAFGLGIIGTGLLAIPILAGSVGYILSEIFDWQEGLNKKFREAKGFYMVIIASTFVGMIINFFGIDPIKILIYAAVFYAIITPVLIFLILKISNNRKIMNYKTNSRTINILGGATFLFATFAVISYLISVLF